MSGTNRAQYWEEIRGGIVVSELSGITAATVNGKEVSLADVLQVLKADGKLQFLQEALRSLVITDAAQDAGLGVSDEELQAAADRFRQRRGLQSADDTMTWLKQRSLTLDDLEDRLCRAILVDKLREQVVDGKEEQYLAEHRADFDAATVSHIVVADEGLAQELKSQIDDEEEDFAVLARQHSIDAASASNGGRVGKVGRNMLAPMAQAAVFGASAGDVVGPVKTDQGYHIIQVESLTDGSLTDEIKSAIQARMFNEFVADAYRKAGVKLELLNAF